MFLTGKAVAALALAAVTLAGCSSSGDDEQEADAISVTTMRGALLQATDIGPTWTAPDDASADPQQMVSICGGTTTPPTVPPGGEVVSADFEDSGDTGAQTLTQTALVFPSSSAATAAQTALQALAQNCPATQTVPDQVTTDKSEPGYTETVQLQDLKQDAWAGFAVLRHKQYEKAHASTADTAVVILQSRNVVFIDAYAIYRLNNTAASAGPDFAGDWEKLVGSVLNRVG